MTDEPFNRAVKIVLASEGYFSDDPNDVGGATYFGIARKFHPDVEPWPPSKEQAIAIYKSKYWDRYQCGEMPFPLDIALFDATINQPAGEIIAELQRSLKVEPDGIVGDDTIFAARTRDVWETLALFFARRVLRYAEKSHPSFRVGLCARLFRTQRAILGNA
jgi:lysozyme family protein